MLTTHSREPHFRDTGLASQYAKLLEDSARRYRFRLLAYCFMPEHTHVLLVGRANSSDLIRLVQRYKQVTAFQFRRANEAPLWQQSFFDRALRAEEDLAQIAAYIFENPVRAGLASDPTEYPLSGGEYFPQMADGAEAPSLRSVPVELARE